MASVPIHTNRRRSLSASTSESFPRSRRSQDWRGPTKRVYPFNSVHDASAYFIQPSVDADTWRQKKRRRDHSPPLDSIHAPSVRSAVELHTSTIPPTTSFASTPAEFHLLPKRVHDVRRPYDSTPNLDSPSFGRSAPKSHDLTNLSNLRSNAFEELHRTVAETGEGLIQRMREYELLRSKSDIHMVPRRGRAQSSHGIPSQKTLSQRRQLTDADDEEVQILLPKISSPGCFRRKKRAVSLGPSDCSLPFTEGEWCPSPPLYPSSTYHSDGDESHISGVGSPSLAYSTTSPHRRQTASSLALSHTLSNSTNPSLVSFDLPPPIPCNSSRSPRPGPVSTRSEKAIASLALAMANGAGGLVDYRALLAIQATPALDNSQVGEMWH